VNTKFVFSFLMCVCMLSPFITYAMDPEAPAMQCFEKSEVLITLPRSTKMGECFDRSMMCLCGPCFRGGTLASKRISKRCIGIELPLSASCQGCAMCCSPLVLFGHVFLPSGNPVPLCAACSSASAASLTYLVLRLEHFQARNRLSEKPDAVVMGETTSKRQKAE
jgi:hypothetical protein